MAANFGPILLGLGAAFLLFRKKGDASAPVTDTGGFGNTDAGGTSACHLLEGIWAPANTTDTSPLLEITSNTQLAWLPLTPAAFQAADLFLQGYFQNTEGPYPQDDSDEEFELQLQASKHLTDGLDCSWSSGNQTPRMKQIFSAMRTLYRSGVYAAFKG